jgi:hypothetical protein
MGGPKERLYILDSMKFGRKMKNLERKKNGRAVHQNGGRD